MRIAGLRPSSSILLSTGAVFGEMALLRQELRTATVVTVSECQLLVLDSRSFERLLVKNPSIRTAVEGVVRTRTMQ